MTTASLINAMRAFDVLQRADVTTITDLPDMLARVRGVLDGDGRIGMDLDHYITEQADTRERAILEAFEEERLPLDGRGIDRGEVQNLFGDPALVYGIALGLLLAEQEGGTR